MEGSLRQQPAAGGAGGGGAGAGAGAGAGGGLKSLLLPLLPRILHAPSVCHKHIGHIVCQTNQSVLNQFYTNKQTTKS